MRFLFIIFIMLLRTGAAFSQHNAKPKVIKVIADSVATTTDIQLVFVQGGLFSYVNSRYDTGTIHVNLKSFYMGKYEVTQAQWKAVMHTDPDPYLICDNCPVENVSHDEAQEFIDTLNAALQGKYRLPTEAEWEYAAAGGALTKHYTYSGSNSIDEVAWYSDNSGGRTHPVGRKKPNELGLYDMSGNVDEWCSDSDYFVTPGIYDYRLFKGGNFQVSESDHPFFHFNYTIVASKEGRFNSIGFRLVRDL